MDRRVSEETGLPTDHVIDPMPGSDEPSNIGSLNSLQRKDDMSLAFNCVLLNATFIQSQGCYRSKETQDERKDDAQRVLPTVFERDSKSSDFASVECASHLLPTPDQNVGLIHTEYQKALTNPRHNGTKSIELFLCKLFFKSMLSVLYNTCFPCAMRKNAPE